MRVLVINGPNLNMLGQREPGIYGSLTLDEILERVAAHGVAHEITVEAYQSNHEGEIVTAIQEAPAHADAIIINAGGYSHTSVAIHDALRGCGLPAVAVHLSNPHAREAFRHTDLVAAACRGAVAGFGWRSYLMALDALRDTERA